MATVRELMASDPVTVEPEETLRKAADLLTASGVSGAPVTANGRVVGVVTLTDITQFEAETHETGRASIGVVCQLKDRKQLDKLLREVRGISGVLRVDRRMTGGGKMAEAH